MLRGARPTHEELRAHSARLDAVAKEEAAESPGSDAARIARLEADSFVLQVGVSNLTRTLEALTRVLDNRHGLTLGSVDPDL